MTCFIYLQKAKIINDNESVNRTLLIHLLQKDITWLYTNLHYDIHNLVGLAKYLQLVRMYVNGCPLAYITGYVFFLAAKIKVNRHVLIPRDATEQLVQKTISYCQNYFTDANITALDLGTGSGCIAISLGKHFSDWKIVASDISEKALKMATINIQEHGLTNITVIKSNCFNNLIGHKFDLIVANPPYIDQTSFTYNKTCLKYEPSCALFAQKQGLAIYEQIFNCLHKHLTKKFFVALEIGFDQKEQLIKLLQQLPLNCHWWFEKDWEGHWRYLFLKNVL